MVSPILAEPSYAGCVVVMVFFCFSDVHFSGETGVPTTLCGSGTP